MKSIVCKFELFGEAPNVLVTLRAFRANFERVVAGLEQSWAKLQDAPSTRGAIQAKLEEANAALRAAAGLDVVFVRKDKAPLFEDRGEHWQFQCSNCGATGKQFASRPPADAADASVRLSAASSCRGT